MNSKEATSARRAIPDDYVYNPKKLKHLKNILHNVSVALGTLSSAHHEFSKLKGPEISPDGLLGGVGYIIPLQEIKQTLNTSIHGLSNLADCIADELTNPRWNAEEDKEVKELIKEKEEVKDEIEEVPGEDQQAPQQMEEGITPNDITTVDDMENNMTPKEASEDKIRRVLSSAITKKLSKRSYNERS
jgi:hypothetical protein